MSQAYVNDSTCLFICRRKRLNNSQEPPAFPPLSAPSAMASVQPADVPFFVDSDDDLGLRNPSTITEPTQKRPRVVNTEPTQVLPPVASTEREQVQPPVGSLTKLQVERTMEGCWRTDCGSRFRIDRHSAGVLVYRQEAPSGEVWCGALKHTDGWYLVFPRVRGRARERKLFTLVGDSLRFHTAPYGHGDFGDATIATKDGDE